MIIYFYQHYTVTAIRSSRMKESTAKLYSQVPSLVFFLFSATKDCKSRRINCTLHAIFQTISIAKARISKQNTAAIHEDTQKYTSDLATSVCLSMGSIQ